MKLQRVAVFIDLWGHKRRSRFNRPNMEQFVDKTTFLREILNHTYTFITRILNVKIRSLILTHTYNSTIKILLFYRNIHAVFL